MPADRRSAAGLLVDRHGSEFVDVELAFIDTGDREPPAETADALDHADHVAGRLIAIADRIVAGPALAGQNRAGAPGTLARDERDPLLASMTDEVADMVLDGKTWELCPRGFLRRVDSEGDWRWIRVTTPTGEFTGHLQSPVNFVANPGALIRQLEGTRRNQNVAQNNQNADEQMTENDRRTRQAKHQ